MTEAESSIRESLLMTLAFLASPREQLEFATKVHYDNYQDEFACWWFDAFIPDEPGALQMFKVTELEELRRFSETFDRHLRQLPNGKLSLAQLQAREEWQAVTVRAQSTLDFLQIAPNPSFQRTAFGSR